MKKLLLLLVLLLPFVTQAQDNALNEKYGFRDATFEKPLSAFKGMKLTKTLGRRKTYVRPTDKASIGQFPVSIEYAFYDNLLSEVLITAKGAKNVDGVGSTMIQAYGPPLEGGLTNTWRSSRVILIEKIAPNGTSATFQMASIPMYHRQKEAAASAEEKDFKQTVKGAKKAAADL